MTVADLLQTINNTNLNSSQTPFKIPKTIKAKGLNVNAPVDSFFGQSSGNQNQYATPGSTVQALLQNTKNNAQSVYDTYRQNSTGDLAQSILKQSSDTVPVDKYGIVQQPASNSAAIASNNLSSIDQLGKTALAGAQDQAAWKQLNNLQNANQVTAPTGQTYDPKYIAPGASKNNPGALAVAQAMTAFNNNTPYVWGGNSLMRGVDCSGLMQQAYAKIGIKIPRTTYEQAKSGTIIRGGVENALPGDMIFYNTGSSDPNGIGKNSHVAMYLGNGMVLEAYNSRVGIRKSRVTADGTPSVIVRPWS